MIGNVNDEYIRNVFGDDIKYKIKPGDLFDRITFIKSDKYKSADIVHVRGSSIDMVKNLVDYAITRVLNLTNEDTSLHLFNVKLCINYIFTYGFAGLTKNEQNKVIKIFGIFVETHMTEDAANRIVSAWELADSFKPAFYEYFNTFNSLQMCKDFLKFFIDNLDDHKTFWNKIYATILVEDSWSYVRNLRICDLSNNLISLDDDFYRVIRDKTNTIWGDTYYILVDAISK